MTIEQSFTDVFSMALQGLACEVVGLHTRPRPLPTTGWSRAVDADDGELLDLCDVSGPVLDVGCGPGRLAGELARRGVQALGIDVVPRAVEQAMERGAVAIRRDVFAPVPGEGLWSTVLLADGNIGIGGDPVALLGRCAALTAPGGRVVVEVESPGVAMRTRWATLRCNGTISRPFRWSVVGTDDIAEVATAAGLVQVSAHRVGERRVVVLAGAGVAALALPSAN